MSLDLTVPSANVPRATSTGLKLSRSASTFRDSVIHIPRVLPTFAIQSSTFLDFTIFSSCFFDLPIRAISSISFSTIIDGSRAPRIHSSISLDLLRTPFRLSGSRDY
jgi:hypothetical protein